MCKLQQKTHFESINIFIPLLSHQVSDGNTQVRYKKIRIAYGYSKCEVLIMLNNLKITTPKLFLFVVTDQIFNGLCTICYLP